MDRETNQVGTGEGSPLRSDATGGTHETADSGPGGPGRSERERAMPEFIFLISHVLRSRILGLPALAAFAAIVVLLPSATTPNSISLASVLLLSSLERVLYRLRVTTPLATIPTSIRWASILMSRLQRVLCRLRVTVDLTALVGAPVQFHRRLPGFRQGLRAEVLQVH